MEAKTGLTSSELLQTVFDLMDGGCGFDTDQPVVLSCGGIQLKGRKVPKNLAYWQTEIFLPNTERAGVRVFRLSGESIKKSLARILDFDSMN
jgi:hypothetical protein